MQTSKVDFLIFLYEIKINTHLERTNCYLGVILMTPSFPRPLQKNVGQYTSQWWYRWRDVYLWNKYKTIWQIFKRKILCNIQGLQKISPRLWSVLINFISMVEYLFIAYINTRTKSLHLLWQLKSFHRVLPRCTVDCLQYSQ